MTGDDATPLAAHGSAKKPRRDVVHERPAGMSSATVAALGKVSEALEAVEQARGLLYAFHRLSGTADLTLGDGVRQLRACGHEAIADEIEASLVGRDVVEGMWTFQLVEAYDRQYWSVFRDVERWLRAQFDAPPHLYEAEMKKQEQDG